MRLGHVKSLKGKKQKEEDEGNELLIMYPFIFGFPYDLLSGLSLQSVNEF